MHRGLHRFSVVVDCRNVEGCVLARVDCVAVRLHVNAIGSVRRKEAAAAGDLPIRLVCDAGFHGVVQIAVLAALVELGGNGDGELAVRIQLRGVFGLLVGIIELAAVSAVIVGRSAAIPPLVVALVPPVVSGVIRCGISPFRRRPALRRSIANRSPPASAGPRAPLAAAP